MSNSKQQNNTNTMTKSSLATKTLQSNLSNKNQSRSSNPSKYHFPHSFLTPSQKDLPPLPPPRTNFYLEYGYIATIAVYLVLFWIGKSTNESIAKSWASSVTEIVTDNFSKVGLGITPRDPKATSTETLWGDTKVIKESHNIFKLKATGRQNCVGFQATLEVKIYDPIIIIHFSS
jgi:hypothetical protein